MLLCATDHCFGLLDLVCGAGLFSPTSLPLELSRAVRAVPRVQLLQRELAMWHVLKEALKVVV